jgi:hypothetical protein
VTDPPPPSGTDDLVERVRSGDDPKLVLLAAQGLLPIAPEDLAPLQVGFAEGSDPDLAGLASASLASLPAGRVAGMIHHGASREVLVWFARTRDEADVLEAVLRRRDVPRELLAELAAKVPERVQEVLLLRQDAILERPEILDALEGNPELSAYSRRRIVEFRTHLLPSREEAAEVEEPEEEREPEPSDEEVLEAIEEAHARTADAGAEVDHQTGLTEIQVRLLPVPVRRKLARGATKSLRWILIRDPNPQVAVTAPSEGGLSEGEVEQVAANRAVVGDVLEEVARRRDWVTKPKIVSALVHNPRTPAGVAIRLLPRIPVRELSGLSKDRNISSAVRTQAGRLYRMRRR